MIKHILFGTDGSPRAHVARDFAIDFALRLDAQLEAVHVLDSRLLDFPLLAPQTGVVPLNAGNVSGLQDALRERGRTLLREAAEHGQAAGIAMEIGRAHV